MKYLPILAAAVAACVTAAVGSTAAQAQPAGLYAPSALVLSIGAGDSAEVATVERAVTLSCSPRPSGTHPAPRAACSQLRGTDAAFEELVRPAAREQCSVEWAPVTVTADGVWQGRRLSWQHTFTNACHLHASTTGAVFSF
ncbi:subtilase-type protease inhibitor [Streptomyces sp. H27-H1]|uniref:subtilase-type protease inhibitor n=1 Tax=Streptomyces sp. H27-H1 TaxID=2996461 RepID=UPI0022707935|nr:subtilase-type protease inhibitor [Streptomyces sp. H27-H1]MCY0932440.1 subtilase-type protease inhibitor [Streptomyces sp. H27-H1]